MGDAPKNIFFQVQSGHNQVEYLGLRDALIKDLRGRPQPRNFNSVHGCSPLFREALEDQIAYAGSLGLNNVQQYDYTWYYPDGPWGFDRYSAEAFREDLSEKDEGLTIGASRGKVERTIHFWDYYECYCGSGTRLDASRLGLASWGEFQPKFDTPLRQRLHWLLVTYEWLRQAQRFGHWSRKYCYGAPHDYLLNGEGSVNGNDHVYLLRLKDTGIVSPEYFHNTCRELGVIYHSAGRYIREAKRYGKVLGLTVETSSGGGSTQAYWSCKTGYVIGYVLSALGHESFEYDHLPDGASWKDHLDRENKPGLWKNLALGMSLARAYRQAKLDGATLAGLAIRRQYRMWFKPDKSGPFIDWLLVLPNRIAGEKTKSIDGRIACENSAKVPVVLMLNYPGNHAVLDDAEVPLTEGGWFRADGESRDHEPKESDRGVLRRSQMRTTVPAEFIVSRGYAFLTACYAQVSPDVEVRKGDKEELAYSRVFELWGKRDESRTDNTTALATC